VNLKAAESPKWISTSELSSLVDVKRKTGKPLLLVFWSHVNPTISPTFKGDPLAFTRNLPLADWAGAHYRNKGLQLIIADCSGWVDRDSDLDYEEGKRILNSLRLGLPPSECYTIKGGVSDSAADDFKSIGVQLDWPSIFLFDKAGKLVKEIRGPKDVFNEANTAALAALIEKTLGIQYRPSLPQKAESSKSPTERLRLLKEAFDAGLISKDEYDRKRAQIIEDL